MNTFRFISLSSLLSGGLAAFSLPPYYLTFLLFVAFIPNFHLINILRKEKIMKRLAMYFLFILLQCGIWSGISAFWLIEISPLSFAFTALASIVCLFITTSWTLFINNRTLQGLAYILSFVVYEYWLDYNILTTPHITIGTWLAYYDPLTQYYQYTGIKGGTAWVLAVNLSLYFVLNKSEPLWKRVTASTSIIALPIIFSLIIYYSTQPKRYNQTILLGNTSIDIYDPKLNSDPNELVEIMQRSITGLTIPEKIDLAVFPEGISNQLGWVGDEQNSLQINLIDKWRKKHNIHSLIFGGLMYKQVQSLDIPMSAEKDGYYYTTHNVAVQLLDDKIVLQGKEGFVPFQESVPYNGVFDRFSELFKQIGYATKISKLEESKNHLGNFKTLVCFESIRPFLAEWLTDKDFLVIISSESWSKRTAQKQQFDLMIKGVAMAQNKTVVKASNQGNSLYVNNKGKFINLSHNNKSTLIKL